MQGTQDLVGLFGGVTHPAGGQRADWSCDYRLSPHCNLDSHIYMIIILHYSVSFSVVYVEHMYGRTSRVDEHGGVVREVPGHGHVQGAGVQPGIVARLPQFFPAEHSSTETESRP